MRYRSMAEDENIFAYAGKILRVNLTSGDISTEPTMKYAKEWLGASGMAIKILYDELRSWVTPYEPANKLILSAGALVGTTAPGACKSNMSTLGPVTGGWASSCSDSYAGGQLKYAGYDSVIIEGKGHTPVYLWVSSLKAKAIPRFICGCTTNGLRFGMPLTFGAGRPGKPLTRFGKSSGMPISTWYPLGLRVKI
jgi:hypothetical protein